MDSDTALRIAHAILNGAKLVDIAKVNNCTIGEVTKAWESVAAKVKNPPGSYHNQREVALFSKEWRKLICAMG